MNQIFTSLCFTTAWREMCYESFHFFCEFIGYLRYIELKTEQICCQFSGVSVLVLIQK